MIRCATVSDIPKLIELAASFHQKSAYREYELCKREMYKSLSEVQTQKLGFLRVADHGGILTGMLAGAVQSLWFTRDQYASDLIFVSRRPGDGAELVKQFTAWAFGFPRVRECTLAVSSGIHAEATGALYEGLGYRYLGPMYILTRAEHEQGLERA